MSNSKSPPTIRKRAEALVKARRPYQKVIQHSATTGYELNRLAREVKAAQIWDALIAKALLLARYPFESRQRRDEFEAQLAELEREQDDADK